MKVLVLDTSGQVASCALAEDGRLVAELNLRHGMTHSAKLLPLIESCMELADWNFSDLTHLGVVSGPGSFTGLRIGAATIKGLAFALKLPVIPVGTLEVLARSLPGVPGLIVPLLDARRGEVYAAAYRWQGEELTAVAAPCAMDLVAFLETLPPDEPRAFVGDGVAPNEEKLSGFLAPEAQRLQRAACVAEACWAHYQRGEVQRAEDFLPDYLRDSSAVPPAGLKLWDF